MKHKKITVIVLAGALLAGTTFGALASGQSEANGTNQTAPAYGADGPTGGPRWNTAPGARGYAQARPGYMMGYQFNKEDEITVTGKIELGKDIHPTLKSGGEEYELLVPLYLVYQSGIKDGAEVTVTGYKVANPPMDQDQDSNEIHVFVTKAKIDGKEYDLRSEIGTMGMMGRRMGGKPHGGSRGGYRR